MAKKKNTQQDTQLDYDTYIKQMSDSATKVLKELKNQSIKDIQAQADEIQKQLDKVSLRRKNKEQQINRDIADATLIGALENEDAIAKYRKKLEGEYIKQDKEDKLQALKDLSKSSQKQREKEQKSLDKQIEKQEKLNEIENSNDSGIVKLIKTAIVELPDALKKFGANLLTSVQEMLHNMSTVIDNTIESYSNYQGTINARLQGVSKYGSNPFSDITNKLSAISMSGFLSASDLYENLNTIVGAGIGKNVEQLAMLQTIKDDIASTFDVTDSTLRQIVRVQQEDSTASRLGMESYLTKFLNEFTETTEYLESTFDNVASALYEASATMTASSSTEFEYVVQKWLGTLTGYGLSSDTASSIAQAIGYLGSGNISSLSGNNIGTLLAMAIANSGNLSYGDLLTGGLDSSKANTLMAGIVNYLSGIYADYSDNNVILSSLSETFGIKLSDLKAISNLANSSEYKTISSSTLTTEQMYSELTDQFEGLFNRMGFEKVVSNLLENYQYSTGLTIANNPVLYGLWKITDVLKDMVDGIKLDSTLIAGTGVEFNTSVADIMRTGIIGLSSIADVISLVSNGVNPISGTSLLTSLGIGYDENGNPTNVKNAKRLAGKSTSESSSYETTKVYNTSGEDYTTLTEAQIEQTKSQELSQAEQETDTVLSLLEDMDFASKMKSITDDIHTMANDGVSVKNYGLTNTTTISGWTL